MHPYENAIVFLLNEHVRRGDAHASAEAERHLSAIAAARADYESVCNGARAAGDSNAVGDSD